MKRYSLKEFGFDASENFTTLFGYGQMVLK